MKKLLALSLALVMVLALCACGGAKTDEPAPAAEAAPAAPAEEAAPAAPAAPAAAEPAGDASGEIADASGEPSEDNGPVEKFDLVVNAPVIGQGAAEVFAVGGDNDKVVVDFSWSGSNGDTVTLSEGEFKEGVDYTLSLTFKAADGVEMADPVSVKLVGAVSADYQPVASSGVDGNGAPVYEMQDLVTLAAGEEQASGEPSA